MANQEHLDLLRQGVDVWNTWREEHPDIKVDLSGANLSKANLKGVDFSGANLSSIYLSGASLWMANLSRARLRNARLGLVNLRSANLSKANLNGVNLEKANVSEADLSGATLIRAELVGTDFSRANLCGADLSGANLSEADLSGANLTGCHVYAISAWNVQLEEALQSELIITPKNEPIITVDNLKVAQFIYLLLNNQEIRDVIDAITSKVVLILGRFTHERKVILDALRDELRKRNYSPVVFDFEKPANRDVTETVSTLAHLARFVIADITEPRSIPQELSHIVPFLPSVPVMPLLHVLEHEYGMYEHFISYPWVQPIYHYRNMDELLHSIQDHIIDPAERKVKELAIEKAKRLERP